MLDNQIQLLKPPEAAVSLRCSTRTVYNLIRSGQLKACRIGCGGGVLRIHRQDLEIFIDRRLGLDHPQPDVPPPSNV